MKITSEADALYQAFDKHSPFQDASECSGCPIICSREWNVHWLLDIEVQHLSELQIKKRGNAYFFKDGRCAKFNNMCSIYQKRPFECRINPLSIYEIDDELCWIVYEICQRIKTGGVEFIQKLEKVSRDLELYLTPDILENFRRISRVIRETEPLESYMVLRRVG